MTVRRAFAVVLVVLAAYSTSVVIRASFFSDGHGPVFWTAIALFAVFAVGAVWCARRLW